MHMELKKINRDFSVCKVTDFANVDPEIEFCFLAKTDEECSLVCPTERVPDRVIARDDGWKAFRIQGILDFSLIGILADLSALLAQNGIAIFAISTYNTDYLLVKQENYPEALDILSRAGYTIV